MGRLTYYFKIIVCSLILIIFSGKCISTYASDIITIDTKKPIAGEAVEASKGENVSSVKWFVDGNEVGKGDSFIPTSDDYEKWIEVKAFDENNNEIGNDRIYFSRLPVVYINTNDGSAVTSKLEVKDASMKIFGNSEYDSQYSGNITIKVRGNSSSGFPARPYKIKLDKSTDLFGMDKNKHWVLLSNYIDQAALRNKMGSEISAELGLNNMEMTWVDVVLNGEYTGLYMLGEHIRIGKSRIDIFDWEDLASEIAKAVYKKEKKNGMTEDEKDEIDELLCSDFSWVSSGEFEYGDKTYKISKYKEYSKDISGGYIFEMSHEYDELSKFTTENELKVMLNKPEYLYTNEEMMTYVQDYWQKYENALVSENGYNEVGTHYTEYADIDSMVSYWLTMEILGNNDAVYKSRYAYKDLSEKLIFGPVWDFDWGCGSYAVGSSPKGWKISGGTLWRDFVDDPYFQVRAAEKYWAVRDYLSSCFEDGGLIDDRTEYLKEAWNAYDRKYPYDRHGNMQRRTSSSDAEIFKKYMQDRLEWLDKQLKSNESISTSLSNIKSSRGNSYKKQDSVISMELSCSQSENSKNTVVLEVKADSSISDDIKRFELQINGKSVGNIEKNGDKYESYEIPEDLLTEVDGKRNVISVLGRDALGKVVVTNYITVDGNAEKKNEYMNDQILSTESDIYPVYVGKTAQILVDGANTDLIYFSEDPSIATVDNDGTITGISKGETTITIKAKRTNTFIGDTKKITVNVIKNTQNICISENKYVLETGCTCKIGVSGALTDLIFSSDNNSVAKVDQEGNVTAVGKGEAHISIHAEETDEYEESKKNVTIIVKDKKKIMSRSLNLLQSQHRSQVRNQHLNQIQYQLRVQSKQHLARRKINHLSLLILERLWR